MANTWGLLPKLIDDNQTVDEAIAAALAIHNADESAHGQSSEAIYNHRIAEILDHLDDSILPQHISADISTVKYIPKTADQDITSQTVWADVTDLLYDINSSKIGSMLVLLQLTSALSDYGATILVRVKVVNDSGTQYYPSSTGIESIGANRPIGSHYEQMVFPFAIPLIAGAHAIQIQAISSNEAVNVTVQGATASFRSFVSILTVGTTVTEI